MVDLDIKLMKKVKEVAEVVDEGVCMQDYSWEDHGFSLVNRLLPDMGQLLDEKFQVTHIYDWSPFI